MQTFTNKENIPLEIAVLLAYDSYDHSPNPKEISATSLLKPIKQIILSSRVKVTMNDISTNIASTFGTAVHDALENTWLNYHREAMESLGYPDSLVDSVKINPTKADLVPGDIPIYVEQRTKKKIDGWTISGKFDMVVDGKVKDLKTTKSYSYIKKSKDNDYILQGSIYKWLNQDIITEDTMSILYYFTDWNILSSKKEKGYPSSPILEVSFPLFSIEAIENFIKNKLDKINSLFNASQDKLPPCTQKELWQDDPVWKYYKNPDKTARSTKNFDNLTDANQRFYDEGSVGLVRKVEGKVKACTYCPALPICDQAKQLILTGALVL